MEVPAWVFFLFKLQAVSFFVVMKQCLKCYQGGIQPVFFLVFSSGASNRHTNRWGGSWKRSLEQSRESGELQKVEAKQKCIVAMDPVSAECVCICRQVCIHIYINMSM